jgi:hypothetical protein
MKKATTILTTIFKVIMVAIYSPQQTGEILVPSILPKSRLDWIVLGKMLRFITELP